MDIIALQNNGIMSFTNTMSANSLIANYGKESSSATTSDSDSVSISDTARRLFAQSYGQYNGMTASSAYTDAGDSLLQSVAQSYTVKGAAEPTAATKATSAESPLLAATSQDAVAPVSEDAANAGTQGGGQTGGQPAEEDDDSDDESIRQQISSLRARVSMLSSAITNGDTSAYSQLASLEAEISALTVSLSA